jgi:signal transduction histidine kinase/ActR/RegA family two-component response regulator
LLTSIAPHFRASAGERTKQVPVRIVLALVIAWSLFAAGQAVWVLPWLVASAAVQVFEHWAMAPYRRATSDQSKLQAGFALASVLAMSMIHGAMATVLWLTALPVLVTTGLLILCGGLLNNVASATDSRPLFAIGATPYLATLPVMAAVSLARGDLTHLPLLLLVIVLFYFGVISVWRRMHAAKAAETSAREEAQTRLEMAELAMADRAAMAAIVSHELRTPVSAILAGAQVIRDGGRPEKTAETAELIVDAGRLMTSMLNDLLDHSKIEARAMSLEVRDFNLRSLVEDTVRFWEPQASAKGLVLVAETPETLWLKGDPYRIRQVLNNLISNAIKFTEKGEVCLETAVSADDLGADLRMTVRDQGAGIAPEAMERLFTPFAQGSSEVARTYGGTGLGLTVSRDLARLMEGDLTADSRPEQGAAFSLKVRLPIGVEMAEASPASMPTVSLERALRILAVDDHEINRRTLALVLEPLGVELFTASNGMAALEALASQPFDVVLMDVNMPGIDGNETTRRLRASGGPNAGVPVIGFSAGTEAAQIAACRAAGMTDWLPKPLEPSRLYEALSQALKPELSGSTVAA